VRTVKLDSSLVGESDRANVGEWLRIGSEETCDRLYWNFTEDLLFAVRPSHGGRFAYEGINPAFEARLGITSEEVRGMDVADCLGREDAKSVREALQSCQTDGAEVRIRRQLMLGGLRNNFETTVVPVLDSATGSAVRLIGSHRILRNEYLESAAEEPSGRSLISIQEGIQQRIASDLHDSTCQHLIAASLGLMRVRAGIGGSAVNERLCDDIEASLDAALREIRAFAYLLHPQNLTADGLKATIEQYAQGFASRTSLRVSHAVSSDVDRLPYEKQRSLLRVVQEALANVFRHARATEVKIVLDATDSHFRLTISDNGRGLSTGARSMGVGIPAMRARLEQIGGTLDIRSDPATRPSGTVLRAVFPHGLAMKRSRRKPVTVSVGTE
jgi:signal transduction histidine kinase